VPTAKKYSFMEGLGYQSSRALRQSSQSVTPIRPEASGEEHEQKEVEQLVGRSQAAHACVE
jgi:hypothetical protein